MNKEDIEWLRMMEGIPNSVPVNDSGAIADLVQVYSRPIHVNSFENIVKQAVEKVTKRKVYVVTENATGYIWNI